MSFGSSYQTPVYPAQMYGSGYGQAMPDPMQQTPMRQPFQPVQPIGAPQMPQMQVPTPQDPGMIWVQGEAGAKAYMVAAGNSVVLWDSEESVIYIKSADAAGMPYMRILDYTERSAAPRTVPAAGNTQYVTREEFDRLAARFEEMTKGGTEVSNAERTL